MKRSRLFILIPIAAFIMVFTTAAVCGQSTGQAGPQEIKDIKDPDVLVSGKQGEEQQEVQQPVTQDEPETVQQEEEAGSLPTIMLVIYEGPAYAPAGDICYYRVQAEVTGQPQPSVDFSKDDSSGAWGPLKVQVNLTRDNPTYTLTGTAANEHGSAIDTLVLTWACD